MENSDALALAFLTAGLNASYPDFKNADLFQFLPRLSAILSIALIVS
ncbi:hypothetical protein JCM19241_5976 [Vibrio ishigakensis]|uniref:Uncharacterized protein n=1 Tax=Vibrio ishigakensis TaxID=1481914 RepID=A0A0B8QBN8_9VIBR|nr:hypothetical protein JCM19241_5976 [Vibrio ishigakensis]